ncbi:kinase-like protein [Suillus decipiens]|nr:kinase-like protein [Suillus decipiens]
MDDLIPESIQFKIKPTIIPATDIVRNGKFPNYIGGFSDIWRCSMATHSGVCRLVAVKSIRVPSETDVGILRAIGKGIRREAYVWIQLEHDNILPLEGVVMAKEFGLLPAFVSAWMEEGSLDDYLRRNFHGILWERKLSMAREVAAGLQYLHNKDIVHGDLTPYNILVSRDGRLCLGGFHLSMILAESANATFNQCHAGNVWWMPPEALRAGDEDEDEDEAKDEKPTKAWDVYSYGCIMMQVLSGHLPYAWIKSALGVMNAVRKGRQPFRDFSLVGISKEIQQLAQLCCSEIPADRPSVAKIMESLWSQTDITEIVKTMLSQLPVTMMRISQAVLMKYDCHPDGLDVLGGTLRCKWAVHGSSETDVAVKTLRDDVNSQNDINKIFNRIRREMYVREKLKHEIILALYGITEGFGILPSLVYQWMAGGSLHDYMKREYSNLSARQKLDILLEVAHGIEYLHKQHVAHGNLTGDNVLLDGSGRVRIADLSHSIILGEADSQMFSEQFPGDARYTAPEFTFTSVWTGAPKPTKEGDVYSYGCIAILVLSGKVPYWWISEESQVVSEKEKGTWPFHPTMEIDEAHLNLVQQCLFSGELPFLRVTVKLIVFSAANLTNSIKRPNKVPQAYGGFANVHKCMLDLGDVDALPQVVFRYQSLSKTPYADVAVKEINLRGEDILKIINRLFREITLWLKFEHKNIVPLWGVADGFGSIPALVSPWVENGTLTEYLRHEHKILSYSRKFALLEDVARGLQYLHEQSVIHGDLSGNNVLVDKNGTASLTDFGLSAFLPDRMSQALLPTNHICTVPYMAPEYLMFDDEDNISPVFTPKSDVYAFGGIMLLARGKVPYHYICNQAAIINSISHGKIPRRPSVIIDSDWSFMQTCWLRDMERRPSDEDILEFVEGRVRIQP